MNSVSSFFRFIFWHAVMCALNAGLIFLAASRELAYIFENVQRARRDSASVWIALLNYFNTNPLMLFFLVLSVCTAFALASFYLFIGLKYCHGLTFNEEDKFDRSVPQLSARLDSIRNLIQARDEKRVELGHLRDQLRAVEEWVAKYRRNYASKGVVSWWVRLMLF